MSSTPAHYSLLDNASHVQISGGTFYMGPSVTDVARDLLVKHVAPNALPDSDAMYDGPKCYPETRKAIHRKLGRWIRQRDDLNTRFIWLQGGAGAGKSAIMRTTALGGPGKQDDLGSEALMAMDVDSGMDQDLADKQHVLGSFFFSRQDSTRNTARSLVPTLALQLCDAHPTAKDIILKTITEKRELIFTTSLRNQVRSLLLVPLRQLEAKHRWLSCAEHVQDQNSPGRVFIIDGLDECSEPKRQTEIIEALAILVEVPAVRVLLASRPDEPISSAIRNSATLSGIYSEIPLSDDPNSASDIRLFLAERLKEIREHWNRNRHCSLPKLWPAEEDIDELVEKSSNHFIYASTTEKYISSGDDRPDVALRVVLGLQPVRTGQPFEELDTLYRYILNKARFQKEVLEIFALSILSGLDEHTDAVCYLLGYCPRDLHHYLSDMSSLVIDQGDCIHWRHKSFEDFLRDKTRARELYIGTEPHFHCNRLQHYFALLDGYIATPTDNYWSYKLVRCIAAGIAASPVSDTTTELIKQHPPRLVYNFLMSDGINNEEEYGSYMRAIRKYDPGILDAYDNFNDFVHHLHEIVSRFVSDSTPTSIVIPILLVGADINSLSDIWTQYRSGQGQPRRVHKEIGDVDDHLSAATLIMLRTVTRFPGWLERIKAREYWKFWDVIRSVLKAVTFLLPKVAYRDEIAFYAACQLPSSSDLCVDTLEDNRALEKVIRSARRAMDAYLRRGGYPATFGMRNLALMQWEIILMAGRKNNLQY